MSTRPFRQGTTRRELLKLSPALLLGAFAVPAFQDRLLETGVRVTDTGGAERPGWIQMSERSSQTAAESA